MLVLLSTKNVVSPTFSFDRGTQDLSERSRRDDIESLAYTILDIYVPGLPWFDKTRTSSSSSDDDDDVYLQKRVFLGNSTYMCLYPSLMAVLLYARTLGFKESPDYDLLQAMFVSIE